MDIPLRGYVLIGEPLVSKGPDRSIRLTGSRDGDPMVLTLVAAMQWLDTPIGLAVWVAVPAIIGAGAFRLLVGDCG